MTRPSTPPILSEIRSASSLTTQVAALRALKNEVIGHDQKKEMWIGLGVLAPIARILNTHKGSGKRRHRDANNGRSQYKQRGARSEEEEARLQATIIVGSLALGGPAYISPIHAGLVVSPLLSLLSPAESSPQLVLAALRTLNALADSLLLSQFDGDLNGDGLLGLLYTEQHLSTLNQLLLQTSQSLIVQEQVALTAALINKTCQEEHHRTTLAQAGILEALAVKLASFIVTSGCALNSRSGQAGGIHPSAPRLKLSPILQAISAIIQHSKLRAVQFLSAPAFVSVFQRPDADNKAHERTASLWGSNASNTFTTRQSPPSAIDILLPTLPSSHHRSSLVTTSNFPPLGTHGSSGKQPQTSRSFSTAIEVIQSHGLEYVEEDESPLLSWLLYIARLEDEVTSLTATWVLAILHRHGLTKRGRDTTFALLLVPSLSRMLDKDLKISPDASYFCDSSLIPPDRFIKEQAPLVLATLAANSLDIQKASVEAGVIKKLSHLLKGTYDSIPEASPASLWSPEPSRHSECPDEASKLGHRGLTPTASHVMGVRASVLVALAAIASAKDEYRKSVIENGVVPFVIKTMIPNDIDKSTALASESTRYEDTPQSSPKDTVGNHKDAILAACGAATALSRSVSTLRTSLMDSGLTAPIFVLLKNQDVHLQIAATAVVCNLISNFSPMQEPIIAAGALPILCDHAHSANNKLRLNSIWALKNLVWAASNDIKMRCLEELGPGWLKQIMSIDVDVTNAAASARGEREEGSATPMRMSTPNAAGEQVDLLNAVEENTRESSQDVDEGGEDLKMTDSIGALSRADLSRKTQGLSSHQQQGRSSIYESSGMTSRITEWRASSFPGLSDDLAIQVQGLDFLRNLICGDGNAEMIDHVFQELGQDKLFDMLAAKLRPRVFNAFNRERRSSESGVRHVQPQTDLVIAICYILVHLAAGNSRQRQLLVAQTELLKLTIPFLNHPDGRVRIPVIATIINLTWVDDASDQGACKSRARELAKLGVYEKLQQMENDSELDVRERAKVASSQMSGLLRL